MPCLISPKAETTVNISCLDLVRKKKKKKIYNKTTWNIKLHIRTPGTGLPMEMAIKTSKALSFNILVHVLL